MKLCQNPRCADPVAPDRWLCPSCRLAAQWGAVLAGGVAFALKLSADLPWLAWTKLALGWLFR